MMAYYTYKRLRELIPEHLEEKYKLEWEEYHKSEYGKQQRIDYLLAIGNSLERAQTIWEQDEWFWNTDYDGDLFDAAADLVEELNAKIKLLESK